MTTIPDDAIRSGRLCAWPYVLLCVAAWLFIWKAIGPAQLYHHQTPVFMTGWGYLATNWASGAGGLIEYAGAGLTQTYHRPWLGALLLAILLGSVVVLSKQWLEYVTYRSCVFSGFVPAALLLAMLNGRVLPIAAMLALVLALLAAVVFGLVVTRSRWAAPVALVLLSLFLYPVVAGPLLLFLALAIIQAALRRRFLLVGLGVLLAGAIPHFIGVLWWHCGVYDAWLRNLLFEYDLNPQILSTAIYAFYPLAVVLLAIGSVRMRRRAKAPVSASASVSKAPAASAGSASTGGSRCDVGTSGTRRRSESRQPKVAPVLLSWRRMLAGTGAVAVFAAGSLWVFRDGLAPTILRVDRHAREQEWQQVLAAAGPLHWSAMESVDGLERLVFLPYLTPRFPRQPQQSVPLRLSYESLLRHVNLALQERGRLLDELFAYPQVLGMSAVRMLPDNLGPYVAHSYNIDILLRLGHVNEAERVACEVLANIGPRPWLLQRLVMIYVLKDAPATAEVFLAALAKQPGHCDWARRYQRALAEDARLSSDPLASRIRPLMHREDFAGGYVGVNPDEEMLLRLLHANPHNRAAFDFLMAHYLLNLRHDQVVRRLPLLKEFGYDRVPRHMEEAVLMHAKLTGEQPDLGQWRISPATLRRFQAFDQAIERMGGLGDRDPRPVRDALFPAFADTYWFYCLFGNTFFEGESPMPQEERRP